MSRRSMKRRATKRRVVNRRRKSMRTMRGGDFDTNVRYTSGFAERFTQLFREMMNDKSVEYQNNIQRFLSLEFGNLNLTIDNLMDVDKLKFFSGLWASTTRPKYEDDLNKLGSDWVNFRRTKVLKFFDAVGKGTIKYKK